MASDFSITWQFLSKRTIGKVPRIVGTTLEVKKKLKM
jgi:hypothetical protein